MVETIQPLDIDSRAEIQQAYHDCWTDIIKYNCLIADMDDYGATYKSEFYRHFQRLYFLTRLAFKEKRTGDKTLDTLLTSSEIWIKKLVTVKAPGKDDILKGHDYFNRLEPYLLGRNLVTIAKGMTGD
jgi:hypothetical protein